MSDPPELEPDALLRALGRHAKRTAPPFDRVWRAAQAQVDAPRSRPFPLRPAFAVAGIAALVAIVMTISAAEGAIARRVSTLRNGTRQRRSCSIRLASNGCAAFRGSPTPRSAAPPLL